LNIFDLSHNGMPLDDAARLPPVPACFAGVEGADETLRCSLAGVLGAEGADGVDAMRNVEGVDGTRLAEGVDGIRGAVPAGVDGIGSRPGVDGAERKRAGVPGVGGGIAGISPGRLLSNFKRFPYSMSYLRSDNAYFWFPLPSPRSNVSVPNTSSTVLPCAWLQRSLIY